MGKHVTNRLTTREVLGLTKPGRYADGGNLYLSIAKNGGRRWTFLYRVKGAGKVIEDQSAQSVPEAAGEADSAPKKIKRKPGPLREIGLGPAPGKNKAGVPLADARARAEEYRRVLEDFKADTTKQDPLAYKRQKETARPEPVRFGDYADGFFEDRQENFKSEKHRAQWRKTLKEHAAPIRSMFLHEITTGDIEKLLKPIAEKTRETAARARGRIERVFADAIANSIYKGLNPARLAENMKERVFDKIKKPKSKKFAAIHYKEMPSFMKQLRKLDSISAYALEFTILTAARTNETIGARWCEIDFEDKAWIIPDERMKMGEHHEVPLSDAALAVLEKLKSNRHPEGFIFPGAKLDSPLSNMAMLECLRGLRGKGPTVHGMRSAFKDYAGDKTSFEDDVSEYALAHGVRNKTKASYRRETSFDKRRELMTEWARYLAHGNVTPMRKAANA